MKTKTYFLLFISILLTAFASCSKGEFDQHSGINLKSGEIKYGLDVNLDANTQNLGSLISSTIDTSERRMNFYNYYLAVSLEDLFESQSFNEYLINLAKQTENKVADLTVVYNASQAYKNIIDDGLENFNITFDEINENFTYNKGSIHESYYPAIFIPNADTADVEKQPIFSANIEADCSSNQNLEDCIVVWYFDRGVRQEAILSEANSLQTSNPIFLLDNAEIGFGTKKAMAYPSGEALKSVETTTVFESYEYRVNEHYEPWPGRTEFTIVAWRIDPQGSAHWMYNSSPYMLINRIQRSEIGDDLTKWVLHCNNYTPYNTNYIYWNTFERDWNRSSKSLGYATANGYTIQLAGERHHQHEWYGWDPGDLSTHNTDCAYIFTNGSKMYENSKGKYKIHRVDQ